MNDPAPETWLKVLHGDCRSLPLEDASVHLVVTSPPYWQLKDYGDPAQIGFYSDFSTYMNDLNRVWMECARVLHPGCRLAINVGDQFARAVTYGRYKVISIQSEVIRFCETLGLDYMGSIIWQKVTTVNTTGGAVIMGSFPHPRNGIVKMDYEYILLFKKPGDPPRVSNALKEASRLSPEDWNRYFYGHWNFPGERARNHLAAFPVELPRRLIRMFTMVGETVLDPFAGSGTTLLAAAEAGRCGIGVEINPDYVAHMKARLEAAHHPPQVEAFQADPRPDAALPYRYQDPHGMDCLVDPRLNTFGSRIEKTKSGEDACS